MKITLLDGIAAHSHVPRITNRKRQILDIFRLTNLALRSKTSNAGNIWVNCRKISENPDYIIRTWSMVAYEALNVNVGFTVRNKLSLCIRINTNIRYIQYYK